MDYKAWADLHEGGRSRHAIPLGGLLPSVTAAASLACRQPASEASED